MKTRLPLVLLSLCLVLATASAASAQTSLEGLTSQDALTQIQSHAPLGTPDNLPPPQETVCDGQTGAAHGLCTAYCEAMDCDSSAPQASQRACDRVKANFQQVTGLVPPCDCPCIGRIPGFAEAASGQYGFDFCARSFLGVPGVIAQTTDPVTTPFVLFNLGTTQALCGFFLEGQFLEITPQQGVACQALLDQSLAAAGVVCEEF